MAALDSLGFILGTAVSMRLECKLVVLRKAEKAAWSGQTVELVDYSGSRKSITLVDGLVNTGDRVLVVDDWSETGAQLEAAFHLLDQAGATVVGASVIRAEAAARKRLRDREICDVLHSDT